MITRISKHIVRLTITITSTVIVLFTINGCSNSESCTFDYSFRPERIKIPATEFKPRHYICYRAGDIVIDGKIDEKSWEDTEWSDDFVDIEGELKPLPLHRTRIKMLWDDHYLYIAAELTEPDIWARLRQRDTVIFYDNDFEVFIDPDGDTHEYMEFEMNAYNTLWDLLLTKPYRDNGRVADAWNINGIKTAVSIHGKINNPSDTDDRWVAELAFPLDVLTEFGEAPAEGLQWRINFSRVNWRLENVNGRYVKAINPETGKVYPEYNWVWSPQGLINMHYPERWGYLQFTEKEADEERVDFLKKPGEEIKHVLRTLYYAQRNYASEKGSYSADIQELEKYGYQAGKTDPCILVKPFGYEAFMKSEHSNLVWTIDNTGKVSSRKTD